MKSFLFSVGDSTDGPVGLCARVKAATKEEALEILKEALPQDAAVKVDQPPGRPIEYVNVYINPDHITLADAEDGETEDEEDDDGDGDGEDDE